MRRQSLPVPGHAHMCRQGGRTVASCWCTMGAKTAVSRGDPRGDMAGLCTTNEVPEMKHKIMVEHGLALLYHQ